MSNAETATQLIRVHRIAWLAACVGLVALLAFASRLLPVTRANYQAEDLHSELWRHAFGEEFDKAVAGNLAWIQDPEAIALRVAGYPNADNAQPEKIDRVLQTSTEAIIVITSSKLMDDSVSKIEYWVEMIRQGSVWCVEWAGYRQQCRRGAFWGWTAGPCN